MIILLFGCFDCVVCGLRLLLVAYDCLFGCVASCVAVHGVVRLVLRGGLGLLCVMILLVDV